MEEDQAAECQALLDVFMTADRDVVSTDYVVGYAHGLFGAGVIDSQKWQVVTEWAYVRK